jgi:hypothetical protein
MTPEEFTAICKRLFGRNTSGYGWQAEMHRQTDCPLRTIQAWANKENPVLPVVAGLLRMLDAERNKQTKGKDNA